MNARHRWHARKHVCVQVGINVRNGLDRARSDVRNSRQATGEVWSEGILAFLDGIDRHLAQLAPGGPILGNEPEGGGHGE